MNAKTVELHLLQSFPPSCVNRDGNNSPKDCTFGDVRRARISSQSLKRAIREAAIFLETHGTVKSVRSRLWVEELAKDASIVQNDARTALTTLMEGLLGGIDESEESPDASGGEAPVESEEPNADDQDVVALRSKILLHLPKTAGEVIVPIVLANKQLLGDYKREKDKAKATKGSKKPKNPLQKPFAKVLNDLVAQIKAMPQAPDIALFGRMLANNLGLNVDAASQVAHAISTHKLSQEMDYWTAVDDLQPSGEPGAGMLGTAEFNASVFYRYACVSLNILEGHLGDEMARKTVEAFLLASWDAIPTGKINGHAHFTPPFLALAVVRKRGMPLNLCNAFLKPVRAVQGKGIDETSAVELLDHLGRSRELAPVDEATYLLAHGLSSDLSMAKEAGYGALVERVMAAL